MKKRKVFLSLVVFVLVALTSIDAEAAIDRVTTQLTADEVTYEATKFPVGQTVYSDDLSETTVLVTGNGAPYRVQTWQNFRINLSPGSLRGRDWTVNMAKIVMIRSGIPKAVMDADGIMGWNIAHATKSDCEAELYIGLRDGRQATMRHRFFEKDGDWYSTLQMDGGTVPMEGLLDWIGPAK